MRDLSRIKFNKNRPYIDAKDNRQKAPGRKYGFIKECSICGDKFFAQVSNKGAYCSIKCKGKSQEGHWVRERNPLWKGGKSIAQTGYILINDYREKHNQILEHRRVMEKNLNRKLKSSEIVHHINGNKQDNRLENLMLFSSRSEHLKFHRRGGE